MLHLWCHVAQGEIIQDTLYGPKRQLLKPRGFDDNSPEPRPGRHKKLLEQGQADRDVVKVQIGDGKATQGGAAVEQAS